MDTLSAFAMGATSRGNKAKVFDWLKAVSIIKQNNAREASAGLIEDWGDTSGLIFSSGEVVPKNQTYTYLASTWATPTIIVDGIEFDCYCMEDECNWNSKTYWPQEAIDRLKSIDVELIDEIRPLPESTAS